MANGEVDSLMLLTIIAASSMVVFAYMLPVVALIVWLRRRHDKTETIQDLNGWDADGNELE